MVERLGIAARPLDQPIVHRDDRDERRHADQNGSQQDAGVGKVGGPIQWRDGKPKFSGAKGIKELLCEKERSRSVWGAGNKKPPGAPGATG
jgi:hypothetical protein